jgi:hypothetical protein
MEEISRGEVPGSGGRSTVPDLSVVVPSVNGPDDLLNCLEALGLQSGGVALEVLVPERCGEAVRAIVRDRYPDARILPVPRGTPIPEMRRVAFAAATGDSVAVIEDHVIVPPDWARSMVDARREGHRVVGGSVENGATARLVDRAAFLCEYGHLLEPQPPGPAPWLTGNNVVYDRALLEEHRDVLAEGRWEDRLHEVFRQEGVTLMSRPEIRVSHEMHYTVAGYAGQRFLYSRAWAGMQVDALSPVSRGVRVVKTVFLPPVLLLRIVRNGWSRPEWRADLLRSLPLLLVFVAAWALGEAAGWVLGVGDAPGRVR